MSSDSEGLPTVLIEALILGVRAISTDCPTGPSEILRGDFARFLSPPGDIDALAENIKAALENYPEITSEVLARFEQEHVARQYLNLISGNE